MSTAMTKGTSSARLKPFFDYHCVDILQTSGLPAKQKKNQKKQTQQKSLYCSNSLDKKSVEKMWKTSANYYCYINDNYSSVKYFITYVHFPI